MSPSRDESHLYEQFQLWPAAQRAGVQSSSYQDQPCLTAKAQPGKGLFKIMAG